MRLIIVLLLFSFLSGIQAQGEFQNNLIIGKGGKSHKVKLIGFSVVEYYDGYLEDGRIEFYEEINIIHDGSIKSISMSKIKSLSEFTWGKYDIVYVGQGSRTMPKGWYKKYNFDIAFIEKLSCLLETKDGKIFKVKIDGKNNDIRGIFGIDYEYLDPITNSNMYSTMAITQVSSIHFGYQSYNVNPKTGQKFPLDYEFDPKTGEKLELIKK